MYRNTFSTTFTAVLCFRFRKKYWHWTLPRIRVQHLCLWLQNEQERQFCEEFAPHPGGTNDNDDRVCEPNNITVQNKIIAKILPVNKFTTLKFLSLLPSMNGYFFLDYYVLLCNTCLYRSVHRHGHHWHSSPGWGVNSSQSCRSCSISGHKQRCWTVLSELRYKVAYNPNTFFLNWKQRTAGKAVEDALQYIKMYVAGVWTKTAKGYFKMSRNKSFDVRARFGAIYSASKTNKYLLKNNTIGNLLLFSELANNEFTCPENSNWCLLLPDSNLFFKFQNNFTAEFWATFS